MELAARRSRQGFTLVEVLVAMVILAVGLLASLVGVMAALDHSQGNSLRDGAVKIAQEQQEAARNMRYDLIQTIPRTQTISRQFRKSNWDYTVNTNSVGVGAGPTGMTHVAVTVQWTFKNKTYSYSLETFVRQKR
jgi:type IV pilus assembly protein PilV